MVASARPLHLCIALSSAVLLVVGLTTARAHARPEELERAREERAVLEEQLNRAVEDLELLSERRHAALARREQLLRDVEQLEADAQHAERMLAQRVIDAYKRGRLDIVQAFLAATAVADVIERAQLIHVLARHDQLLTEQAFAARRALASRRQELDLLIERLHADEQRAADLRAVLDEAFGRARERETDLADRASRQRHIHRPGQRGVYACPMATPYHFRNTWGFPRSGGRRHKGVDMFAPMGGRVFAMTGGVVARHSISRLGGLGLYLRGDDGNVYYYAHLQRIAPGYTPGRRVEAGELVAYNGDTGNARGGAPHVHMEIRPGGGRQVNPYPFAAAACF